MISNPSSEHSHTKTQIWLMAFIWRYNHLCFMCRPYQYSRSKCHRYVINIRKIYLMQNKCVWYKLWYILMKTQKILLILNLPPHITILISTTFRIAKYYKTSYHGSWTNVYLSAMLEHNITCYLHVDMWSRRKHYLLCVTVFRTLPIV